MSIFGKTRKWSDKPVRVKVSSLRSRDDKRVASGKVTKGHENDPIMVRRNGKIHDGHARVGNAQRRGARHIMAYVER